MAVPQTEVDLIPRPRPRMVPEPPRRNVAVQTTASYDEGVPKRVGRLSQKEFRALWNRLIKEAGLTRFD